MSWDILGEAWLWRALATGVLVSASCATIGVFLYLRKMSLVADALSHIALPGIVLAFLVSGGINPNALLIGAAALGAVATLGMERLARNGLREDAAIGVVFTALFALGVILLSSFARGVDLDLHCVLYGDILGVSDRSIVLLSATAIAVFLVVWAAWRWLVVSTFDPVVAAALGVPVVAVHNGLVATASLTAVAAFEAVGAILVVAMFVVPAATAHRLANRMAPMVGWAIAHGVFSTVAGVVASVMLDCSTAGAIVVVGGILYGAVVVFGPEHGVLARRRAAAHA